MPGPNYGALGATFTIVRGMQAMSLIAIIGMTANFIAEMVAAGTAPPNVLIGTLSVVSLPCTCNQTSLTKPQDLYCSSLLCHFIYPILGLPAPIPCLHQR
jgi:hypothetical protein